MKRDIKRIFAESVAFITVLAGATGTAFAQSLPNPLGANCGTLGCPVTKVINFMIMLAIPLCAIMVLIGGFQIITSAGNPEKFKSGRNTILYAAAGFAVVLLAKGVSVGIQSFLK
jgi:hypothetical protein